ncbi:serine/threonine-protein kinase ATR-like [Culicoides brevitarsis]|uniref:serine/threonine-protein kinase ATR-like n=1 Tax=Culicoides brevitarsis TaxID=469753 RepID=UPI00307C850A
METWDTLVPVIVQYLQDKQEHNLKKLFLMIKDTLVHNADVGVLAKVDGGIVQLSSLNSWLIFAIIQAVTNSPNDEEMIKASVQLLTEILAACLSKDLKLFRILTENLVTFIQEIVEILESQEFPAKISFAKGNNFQAKPFLEAKIKETVIIVKDKNVLLAILIAQTQVFAQIFSLIGNSHTDLLEKTNNSFIKIFDSKNTSMRLKIETLTYFTRICQRSKELSHEFLDHLVTIVNSFGNMMRYKEIWSVAAKEKLTWDSIYFGIKMFLREIPKIKHEEPNFVEGICENLLLWMSNGCQSLSQNKSDEGNIRQFVLLAKKTLKKLNDDHDGDLISKQNIIPFLEYLEILPELSSLFAPLIVSEVKSTGESELLTNLVKFIEDAAQKTTSTHNFTSLEALEASLMYWKEIFCLIQAVNEQNLRQSQVSYMKKNDKLPENMDFCCLEALKVLKPSVSAVVTSLLNQISKTQLTLTSDFMAVVLLDFAFAGLKGLLEANFITEEPKMFLFYLLLSPFCCIGSALSSKLPQNIVKFYKNEASDKEFQITIMTKSFISLFNLNLKIVKSTEIQSLVTSVLNFVITNPEFVSIAENCIKLSPHIILNSNIDVTWIRDKIFLPAFNKSEARQELLEIFLDLIYLAEPNSFVLCYKSKTDLNKFLTIAPNCLIHADCICLQELKNKNVIFLLEKMKKHHGFLRKITISDQTRAVLNELIEKYIPIITSQDPATQLQVLQIIPQLIKNVKFMLEEPQIAAWIKILSSPHLKVLLSAANNFKIIINQTKSRLESLEGDSKIITIDKFKSLVLNELIKSLNQAFSEQNKEYQETFLLILKNYSATKDVTETEILDCFRFALRFLVKNDSKVKSQAFKAIETICLNYQVRPNEVFNWYKMANTRFLMDIVATNYCKSKVKMMDSIKDLPRLFGFETNVYFVMRYHKMMIAVLLPLVLKNKKCEDILNEIATVLDRDSRTLIKVSFSIAYPFTYTKFSPEMAQQLIDYAKSIFGPAALQEVIFESEKSVSDILMYYHTNAACVLEIFKHFQNPGNTKSDSISKLSSYLCNNILAVLKHFEMNINGDKYQQTETLLSLGQIIRLIGTERITPFRFKIMTILNTALGTNDHKMIVICIKVWHIFVHTVDMMELGPLLSAIIVSLKPFIENYPAEIDEIFTYLIVENSSLMNKYFTDIFFLEELPIREELKRAIEVKLQSSNYRKSFLEQLDEYLTHICHKNVVVKAFGLKYLRDILRTHRTELNNLIINDASIHPILGGLLRNLMICCKESDDNIQKYAAECLGELGALEPSYLPQDYQPHSEFAFSIHTTEFAKLALDKLCHAYQVQSDVQNVDCFALAIQEVLISNNVDPARGQKLEIWHAMPEKMQPQIEPLLKSHYTAITRRTSSIDLHPIYGSNAARSCEEWAAIWATKVIKQIMKEETRNLLEAFVPSLKRDSQILATIFPYVILHAILSSSEKAQNEIFGEIQTVLEDILNPRDQENDNNSEKPQDSSNTEKSLISCDFFYSQTSTTKDPIEENMKLKCAKIVFGLLDFLERYLCELLVKYPQANEKSDYKRVKNFIEKFDYNMLARANYECEEYARALWYIEQYINYDSGSRLQRELAFLAKIHAELLDPDSVEGAMAVKEEEPSLEEQILMYNVTGRLHESAVCFERIMQLQKYEPSIMKDMVGCYLGLDQPETALLVSESFYTRFADDNPDLVLKANCAEPLWRLSRWDELENLIQEPGIKESDIWGINCGQLLIDFRASKHEDFDQEIDRIRLSLLRVLKTHESEQSIYQKCYSQILKLHMLTEIQKAEETMLEIGSETNENAVCRNLQAMLSDWASRNELLQPTSHNMEPLLCLRRIILNEMWALLEKRLISNPRAMNVVKETVNQSIGKLWVESTRLASKAKMFEQASLYIFNAEKYKPPELYIEKAKLSWEKGDQTTAFKVLDTGINDTMQAIGGDVRLLSATDLKIFGEARLLVAAYNSESAKFGPEFNLKCFKESVDTFPQQEKGNFLYAQYFERLHDSLDDSQKGKRLKNDYISSAMIFYGKSLMYGCNFLYQSMPRLLTIWLDYTARKDENASKQHMHQINQYMMRYTEALPSFMFFTAFSQIVSRICHPNSETYTILKKILINLIKVYPQQSLWMFLAVYKSTYENRVKRCKEILCDKNLQAEQKFIWSFNELTEKLITLTNLSLPEESFRGGTVETTITALDRSIITYFKTRKNIDILMPIQEQMSIVKPPTRDRDKPASHHKPFPNEPIYIHDILDRASILTSLQKPKKITLVGSNGRHYDILMKPKDDLRKDFRLMEFNNVIKQILLEDTDARQRRLHIRTYAVIPLNDECGLIEWVQNVTPYRNIVMRYYKQLGKVVSMRDLKKIYPTKRDSIDKKKQIFETQLLPSHPFVFGNWFRERFPNPHDWYQARCGYIKTLAVMSMVGYVLGLGDRHGENILLDGSCGDVVHVDFNCLFNRGELFDVPEVVPFRLTHNMVKAMGPLGVDGLYRKCCEITMRAMQQQRNTLMSVLKPFVYDPLVAWTKTTSKAQLLQQERTDSGAEENLRQIEFRLKGFVKIDGRQTTSPLSTVGLVNHCITEATNVANLASMYIGWGSYL